MKRRVFIFDDNTLIRTLLEMALEDRGYEVFAFASPVLCPFHPLPDCQCPEGQTCTDVIISDLDMPEVRGLEFVEAQRKKKCKCQHIALISGGWSEPEQVRARQLGCEVFSKPAQMVQIHQWLDAIEETIDPGRKLFDKFLEKGEE